MAHASPTGVSGQAAAGSAIIQPWPLRRAGAIGKPARNVTNVGIGGSDLGPVMAWEALRHYTEREMT